MPGYHASSQLSVSPVNAVPGGTLVSPIQTGLPAYPDGAYPDGILQHSATPTSPAMASFAVPQLGVVPGAVPMPYYYHSQVPFNVRSSVNEQVREDVSNMDETSRGLSEDVDGQKDVYVGDDDDYSPEQSGDEADM